MAKEERNFGKYIVQSSADLEMGYEQCIEEYINYYDSRSKKYKSIYFFWNTVKLVAIACIPIGEILLKDMTDTNWIVIGASSITIFCESFLEKIKARDKYLT